MRFWIEVACSSVEELVDVITRALESRGLPLRPVGSSPPTPLKSTYVLMEYM